MEREVDNERQFTHPMRHDSVRFLGINESGKHVFLNTTLPDWGHLSPEVAAFFQSCDGENSLEDLATRYTIDGQQDGVVAISRLATALRDLGFLQGCEHIPSSATGPEPLGTVALYLTKACNLRCSYCFLDAGKPHPDELTTQEYVNLLGELRGQGVQTLQWLGGEPMLRPDLFEIAAAGQALDFDMHLLTNGTLATPANARKVKELFQGVQVSLDGLSDVNDEFRGKGSFERITKGLRTLLDADNKVVVSCVVTRRNINRLQEYFEYLANLGVKNLHFMNLQSCGRGRDAPSTGVPTFEFAWTLTKLWEQWRDVFLIPIPKLLKLPRRDPKMNCHPGNGVVEIDSIGRVFPCYFFMERGVAAGSIRESSLSRIYSDSFLLNKLRSNTVDTRWKCKDCDYRYLCGGGCMGEDKPTDDFCADSIRFIKWVIMEMEDTMREQSRIQSALRLTT